MKTPCLHDVIAQLKKEEVVLRTSFDACPQCKGRNYFQYHTKKDTRPVTPRSGKCMNPKCGYDMPPDSYISSLLDTVDSLFRELAECDNLAISLWLYQYIGGWLAPALLRRYNTNEDLYWQAYELEDKIMALEEAIGDAEAKLKD